MESITKLRLKEAAKFRKAPMARVLRDIGLNPGFITDIGRKGDIPSSDNLLKFADYLDVSVDYLLGRTDNPMIATPLSAKINPADEERQGVVQGGDVINIFEKEIEKVYSMDEAMYVANTLFMIDNGAFVGNGFGGIEGLTLRKSIEATMKRYFKFEGGLTGIVVLTEEGKKIIEQLPKQKLVEGAQPSVIDGPSEEFLTAIKDIFKDELRPLKEELTASSDILESSQAMTTPDDPNHGDAQ